MNDWWPVTSMTGHDWCGRWPVMTGQRWTQTYWVLKTLMRPSRWVLPQAAGPCGVVSHQLLHHRNLQPYRHNGCPDSGGLRLYWVPIVPIKTPPRWVLPRQQGLVGCCPISKNCHITEGWQVLTNQLLHHRTLLSDTNSSPVITDLVAKKPGTNRISKIFESLCTTSRTNTRIVPKNTSHENAWCKMTINNNKLLKIDFMKLIRFSVKGMRKEQKKTGTKKIDRRKRKKVLFFYHW